MAKNDTKIEWRSVPGRPEFAVTAGGLIRGLSGRELKPMRKPSGHLYVTSGNESKKLYVHRAVLLAFVGPCPSGMEARHFNGRPVDNRLANLRWGTRLDQRADDRRNGVRRDAPHKMTPPRVRAARRFARLGLSTRAIGDRLGVSHTTIRKILNGERFAHV